MKWRPVFLSVALCACSSPREPASAAHASSGAEPLAASCGELVTTLEEPCPSGARERMACLADALAACETASLSHVASTDEGGTVRRSWEVRARDGGGCLLHELTDWRGDPFGPAPSSERECSAVSIEPNVAGCGTLVPDGCTDTPADTTPGAGS